MEIIFKQATGNEHIKEIYEHTVDAFSDSPDFNWTVQEIKNEVKDGWDLYACSTVENKEIIAAVFFKVDNDLLLTKNTAIKMHQQGSGYSHQIKKFFENKARKLKLKKIKHYCRIDNFRMYSLNESHGYEKTGDNLGEDGQVVEWTKVLK